MEYMRQVGVDCFEKYLEGKDSNLLAISVCASASLTGNFAFNLILAMVLAGNSYIIFYVK